MRIKILKLLVLGSLIIACALPVLFLSGTASSESDEATSMITGLSSVETFNANYKAWEAEYEKNGGDRNVVMSVGWFKGLSTGDSRANGVARLNLVDGVVSVDIDGLAKNESWDLWMIDSAAGSILPEANDTMRRLGSLSFKGDKASFYENLGSDMFKSFDMDLIVVTKSGNTPVEDRTLVGSTSLFPRLYRSKQRGQFGVLADADPAPVKPDSRNAFQRLVGAIVPTASAQIGPDPSPSTPQELLIAAGRTSFLNDTFNGNGRTCATCHREDNNLTIDPEFIATLPPNDPLFVAEFTPALANNFEKPVLMRKLGLILENADGFSNLATRFVMRGVPHTLALLPNTLTPVAGGGDGTTVPPNERTGWSGDGAPGTGTLREFIIGAITQHYPKRTNRVVNVDFTLPTVAQLDSLEAFQKSTGRRQDLVLQGPGALSLKSEIAKKGMEIFNNGGSVLGGSNEGAGKCFFCHLNAGASDFFFPGQNANFNTNVEQLPSQPADLVTPAQLNPADGGFGQGAPPPGVFGFGNGSFNTPALVEAADTGPFFHNNAILTIEGAVDFYNSEAFNNAPGFGALIGGIRLEATEVEAVAAFLRVINALENIRSSVELEQRATTTGNFNMAQELIKLSVAELQDAIEVLSCVGLHPDAQQRLREALTIDVLAQNTSNDFARNVLLLSAIQKKNQAKNAMAN